MTVSSAFRETSDRVLALTNVSATAVDLAIPLADTGNDTPRWRDVISRRVATAFGGRLTLTLRPYEVLWLTPEPEPHDTPGVIEL